MSEKRIHELKSRQRSYERRYGGPKARAEIGPVTFSLLAVVAVAMLALLYLAQQNRLATRGYDLADLKRQQQELTNENERLTVEILRAQSVSQTATALDKSGHNGMVVANSVSYAPASGGAVASR